VDKNETIMIFADMNSSSCCFVPDDVPILKVLKEQQIVKKQECGKNKSTRKSLQEKESHLQLMRSEITEADSKHIGDIGDSRNRIKEIREVKL
jgi:hypothetical protein